MGAIDFSKQYQRAFRFDNVGTFICDTWVSGYRARSAMVTAHGSACYYWFPQASIDAMLAEGVELFGSTEKFEKYYSDFVAFLAQLRSTYERDVLNHTVLSREGVARFLAEVDRITFFYQKTEFFFVDEAYRRSADNPTMRENLMRNYVLKEKARIESLNWVYMGDDSYVKTLHKKLGAQFSVSMDELWEYKITEILSLFDGNRVSIEEIEKRRPAKVVFADSGEVHFYFGEGVKPDIEKLMKESGEVVPTTHPTELVGTPASKGKVHGKVKIIVSDPGTYGSVAREIEKMEQGDILVAETTSPEFIPACKKAAAILADQGGMLSHAAVISRELGIPSVIGLKYATRVLKDGDRVEVDGGSGVVRVVNPTRK